MLFSFLPEPRQTLETQNAPVLSFPQVGEKDQAGIRIKEPENKGGLEDGRLFDEMLGCAHAGYHRKSPWRNDQAR